MDQLDNLKTKLELNLETSLEFDVFYGSLVIYPSTLLLQVNGFIEEREKEFLAYMVDNYVINNSKIDANDKSYKSRQLYYLLIYLSKNSIYWESKYLLTIKNIINEDNTVKKDINFMMSFISKISSGINNSEKEQLDFVKEFLELEY